MRRLSKTVLLLALVSGCGTQDSGASRCIEAQRAYDNAEVALQDVADRRRGLQNAADSGTPVPPDRLVALDREERDNGRRGAQAIVAAPACFSVQQVADANEYLDRTG